MTLPITGSQRAPGILDGRPATAPSALSFDSAEAELLRVLARHRLLGTWLDFHHVPGRLRLRAEALKQNAAKLATVCAELAEVPGVRFTRPNPLTGSIVVHYDTSVLPPSTLLAGLQEYRAATRGDSGAGLPSWAEHAVTKVIQWCLEKLVITIIEAVI